MSEGCELGKLGRPDRDGSVQAGREIRAGLGISLGPARPTSQFCFIYCVEFGRGEKLETALLSLSILCKKDMISSVADPDPVFLGQPDLDPGKYRIRIRENTGSGSRSFIHKKYPWNSNFLIT